jgi:hypothetical protein
MIALINLGRLAMVAWIAYALVLIFAPQILHSAPNQTRGITQVVAAFSVGYIMDRILGVLRRRKAGSESTQHCT